MKLLFKNIILYSFAIIGFLSLMLMILLMVSEILAPSSLHFTFENKSQHLISTAVVIAGGKCIHMKHIKPGEVLKRHKVKGYTEGSYDIIVDFKSGKTLRAQHGYITSNVAINDKIYVYDNEIKFENQ